jgi:hypothetical protein
MIANPNPAILTARAVCPVSGRTLRFEAAQQDRRLYYRLLISDRPGGSLTDEPHALATIAFWNRLGWIVQSAAA